MSTKQCLKCNYITNFEGQPPLACPKCEAVYSKVEEALRNGAPIRVKNSGTDNVISSTRISEKPHLAAFSKINEEALDINAFAQSMRNESLYPAWRKIVGFFTLMGYLIAAVVLVATFVSANGSAWALLLGIGISAAIALAAKIGKELSLMLADLSDATVRLAAGKERNL